MHSPILLSLVLIGAIGAVGLAWPAPGGVALVVVTAVGALGLVPRWIVDYRAEAFILTKVACLSMVVVGWALGVAGTLRAPGGPEAALTVSLIAIGSLGLLTTGLLQAEAQAFARATKRLRVRRPTPRAVVAADTVDAVSEAGHWLHHIDSAIVRSAGAGYRPADDEESTGRLSSDELRQVQVWSERLQAVRRAQTDAFSKHEMQEIRALASRLGLLEQEACEDDDGADGPA